MALDSDSLTRTISETSRFRSRWDLLTLVLVFVSCFLVPFQVGFVHEVRPLGSLLIYALDLVFLVDIALNFRTTYRRQGTEVVDPELIRRHYRRGMFPIDLLAAVPFDVLLLPWVGVSAGGVSIVLLARLLRLLRIVRLFVIFRRWEALGATNVGFLRIAKLVAVVVLFLHWTASAWFLLDYARGFPSQSWVAAQALQDAGAGTQYIRSLYWSIVTMTAVGYGDITPRSNLEYGFAMVVMLLGASLWAYIIGNIASLVSNIDSAKALFWNRVDTVNQYLRNRQVPAELSEQVRGYYDYVWARYRGMDSREVLEGLPDPVRLDVLAHLARDLTEHVPLFRECSRPLRNVLLMALQPKIFVPGSWVVHAGETGAEIYFVTSGEMEILSAEDGRSFGTMKGGDYFGDLSMLLDEKRSASVRAVRFSEAFTLSRRDFNAIKSEYPEFRDVLKKISSERSAQSTELLLEGVIL